MAYIDPDQSQCKTVFRKGTYDSSEDAEGYFQGKRVKVNLTDDAYKQSGFFWCDWHYHCPGDTHPSDPDSIYTLGDNVLIECDEEDTPIRVVGFTDGAQACGIFCVVSADINMLQVSYNYDYALTMYDETTGVEIDPPNEWRNVGADFRKILVTAGDTYSNKMYLILSAAFADKDPYTVGVLISRTAAKTGELPEGNVNYVIIRYIIDPTTLILTMDTYSYSLSGSVEGEQLSTSNRYWPSSITCPGVQRNCGYTYGGSGSGECYSRSWSHEINFNSSVDDNAELVSAIAQVKISGLCVDNLHVFASAGIEQTVGICKISDLGGATSFSASSVYDDSWSFRCDHEDDSFSCNCSCSSSRTEGVNLSTESCTGGIVMDYSNTSHCYSPMCILGIPLEVGNSIFSYSSAYVVTSLVTGELNEFDFEDGSLPSELISIESALPIYNTGSLRQPPEDFCWHSWEYIYCDEEAWRGDYEFVHHAFGTEKYYYRAKDDESPWIISLQSIGSLPIPYLPYEIEPSQPTQIYYFTPYFSLRDSTQNTIIFRRRWVDVIPNEFRMYTDAFGEFKQVTLDPSLGLSSALYSCLINSQKYGFLLKMLSIGTYTVWGYSNWIETSDGVVKFNGDPIINFNVDHNVVNYRVGSYSSTASWTFKSSDENHSCVDFYIIN